MPKNADRALDDLCTAIVDAQGLLDRALERAEVLRAGRADGRTYAELVALEERPLIVELLTDALDELAAAGAKFRRAEARALHDHGLSHEAIAALFGVTRQRVGMLLKSAG